VYVVNQLVLEFAPRRTACLVPRRMKNHIHTLSLLSVKFILLATQTDLGSKLESGIHLVRVGRVNTIFH